MRGARAADGAAFPAAAAALRLALAAAAAGAERCVRDEDRPRDLGRLLRRQVRRERRERGRPGAPDAASGDVLAVPRRHLSVGLVSLRGLRVPLGLQLGSRRLLLRALRRRRRRRLQLRRGCPLLFAQIGEPRLELWVEGAVRAAAGAELEQGLRPRERGRLGQHDRCRRHRQPARQIEPPLCGRRQRRLGRRRGLALGGAVLLHELEAEDARRDDRRGRR
mmetsp:Transcript_36714/g.118434  ORF Transcript_36714/g.118434 Transcript_36714/m.118434 type:complete len:221 (-) Transcript_36714:113-775(-)